MSISTRYFGTFCVSIVLLFNSIQPLKAECRPGQKAIPDLQPQNGWKDIGLSEITFDEDEAKEAPWAGALNEQLGSYKAINKRSIPERIAALSSLVKSVQTYSATTRNSAIQAKLSELQNEAEAKFKYLVEIESIPNKITNYLTYRDSIPTKLATALVDAVSSLSGVGSMLDPPTSCDGFRTMRAMSTIKFPPYVTVTESVDSDIIPLLDPAFRSATCIDSLYRLFKRKHGIASELRADFRLSYDFYIWLEELDLPTTKRNLLIKYKRIDPDEDAAASLPQCLDVQARPTSQARHVTFKGGYSYSTAFQKSTNSSTHYLCNGKREKVYRVKDGRYIYNIDLDGKLYLDKDTDNGSGARSADTGHINITRNLVLLSAGEVVYKDGKIISINGNSGHYRPEDSVVLHGTSVLVNKYGVDVFSKEAQVYGHAERTGTDAKSLSEIKSLDRNRDRSRGGGGGRSRAWDSESDSDSGTDSDGDNRDSDID